MIEGQIPHGTYVSFQYEKHYLVGYDASGDPVIENLNGKLINVWMQDIKVWEEPVKIRWPKIYLYYGPRTKNIIASTIPYDEVNKYTEVLILEPCERDSIHGENE